MTASAATMDALAPRRRPLWPGMPSAAVVYDASVNTPAPAAPAPAPRVVLADDERLMREQLRARLAEVWPELQIVAEARNGLEAVQLVDQHRPDIVFLDIRMPGLTGVEAARQIAQLPPREGGEAGAEGEDELLPEIVFITAYDEYAVEAFEQGVADYVLKPAERERLALTVERIRKRLAARASGSDDAPAGPHLQQLLHQLAARLNPGGAPQYLQWIQATVGQSIQMIPVDEVLFFISDEKYTRVQTAQVEALIRKPIKELVDELDPRLFWQIHRSTLVAVKAIAGVARDFRGRQIVSVKGHPEKLEVSRSYTGLFKGM
jgi:DNA-binding LytR/AlgR family response regulator